VPSGPTGQKDILTMCDKDDIPALRIVSTESFDPPCDPQEYENALFNQKIDWLCHDPLIFSKSL
jgi:hypothetical protein